MKCAAIDIGTNTVLMLIADITSGIREILDISMITRLGEGVKETGYLTKGGMERTYNALRTYKGIIEANGVDEILCVGTSALREAKNSSYFIHMVQEKLGIPVRVIREREEAFYTYLSVLNDGFITEGDTFIVDIGGGSTEIIKAEKNRFVDFVSLPVGSVKITEMFIRSDPPEGGELRAISEFINRLLKSGEFLSWGPRLIGTGGTVTNVATIHLGIKEFDKRRIHGEKIPLTGILSMIEKMKDMDVTERRKIVGMEKGREDVLLQGIIILKEIMVYLKADEIIVNANGVRHGVIYEKYSEKKGL
ncbi:MAG: Ppx/GppA family phosphatase [Syntrophorhabdaceae bacterium]|nr:Ppx/GppA family phosphatase [Syntrophorhabdaceae bacterium]